VAVGLGEHELAALLEIGLEIFVAVFHPAAGVRREGVDEGAVGLHRAEERQRGLLGEQLAVHEVVVLAEGGRHVDDARARVERHEVGREHLPHPRRGGERRLGRVEVVRRLVGEAHEVFAREPREHGRGLDLELLGEALEQALGQHELAAAEVGHDVGERRVHRGVHVRRQRPRGGGPHEQLGALERARPRRGAERERDVHARIVHLLVALPYLAGRERGAALGPPPHDLVPLIEQTFLEELGEGPPHALDVAAVVGDVGLLEVDPEAHALGERLPLRRVAEHRVDALLHEGLDSVGLDRGLAVDVELLLDLDLDGQAVGVPARLPRHVVAAHGLVTREEVLHDAREHVAVVRQPVRGGRPLVEDPRATRGGPREALLEDADGAPEREDVPLFLGEVELGGHLREDGFGHDDRGVLAPFHAVIGAKVGRGPPTRDARDARRRPR
jgi:hypothetical protein